ncbi:hypothetical protein L6164_000373 [Bauhinia variegata]|uniref:Uncharacterized protein n=1 Tax=Bauhinia variegata TaxID=167791 RepID=A0ACB9Q6K1_BAUVA|nr:hypothetical protein L6164_000373 [Bauhinia variegata]
MTKGLSNTKWCLSKTFPVYIFPQTQQQNFHSILYSSSIGIFLHTQCTTNTHSIFKLNVEMPLIQTTH